ncbi:hypothetical protein SISNIDRAFT_406175, partial [Sistotremastrum niveocremeum HHB9708]
VDTNLSAHNPRDPYSAFQNLRTLLDGIKTSKHGMTPEEHRLSLHLLGIVEPFVGSSPNRKNLISQPYEILDEIVFHIDSKKDLLSFALTCERMHGIIHPRHFEYRVISAKISSLAVWRHIIGNKALARGVRRLEILDDRDTRAEVIPSSIKESNEPESPYDVHGEQEALLIDALKNLTTLSTFVWSCTHSPICVDAIWPTLVQCEMLKDVQVSDNLLFGAGSSSDTERAPTPSMRSVSLQSASHAFGMSKNRSLTRVSDMIVDRCPNLESLDVQCDVIKGASKPQADEFLASGRWPALRSLTLRSFWCSTHGLDAAASFLADHVNLEVLHLDVGRSLNTAAFTLPPNSLPRLKELRSSKEVALSILSCPCDVKRPVETIKGVNIAGAAWDPKFGEALKKHDIRRLELLRINDIDDLRRLVDYVPKLTWLDVGQRANTKTGPITIPNAGEWAAVLSKLPELTTFHGIHLFYESPDRKLDAASVSDQSKITKNNEIANVLAWKLPKLRRMDHWEDGSGKVMVILREGDKVRWEVRRLKA